MGDAVLLEYGIDGEGRAALTTYNKGPTLQAIMYVVAIASSRQGDLSSLTAGAISASYRYSRWFYEWTLISGAGLADLDLEAIS